ncbi:MAG: hypothetical protein V1799_07475 [bacterium]
MPSVECTLNGDWSQAKRYLALLPKFIKALQHNIAADVSEEYYQALVDHFKAQDLPLAPLSAWYKEWKVKRGLDTRILIATGQMLDSIKKSPIKDGKAFVGIKGGKRHRGSKLDIALIALMHEYGDPARNVPARPVYRLTAEELKDKLQPVLQTIVNRTRVEVFGV